MASSPQQERRSGSYFGRAGGGCTEWQAGGGGGERSASGVLWCTGNYDMHTMVRPWRSAGLRELEDLKTMHKNTISADGSSEKIVKRNGHLRRLAHGTQISYCQVNANIAVAKSAGIQQQELGHRQEGLKRKLLSLNANAALGETNSPREHRQNQHEITFWVRWQC